MVLHIPDEVLRKAGLTDEREALVEFACRLFQAGKLGLWPAARLAGMTRAQFEEALGQRNIPVYAPTVEDFRKDVETLRRLLDR
jgi:predicted HTH domain antitoxin